MTRDGEPIFTRWIALFPLDEQYDEERNRIEDRHDRAYERLLDRHAERLGLPADAAAVYDAADNEFDWSSRDAEVEALRQQWTCRYERYSAAFEAAARVKAAELRIEAPIEFRAVTDPDTAYEGADNTGYDDDALAFRLWEHAREVVPMELLTTDDQEPAQ
jgi:hypothetical protein